MIKSMTGYGKSVAHIKENIINIEIRCLNSKQLDLNMRIPSVFREKEAEIRSELTGKLKRGKVDFYITFENNQNLSEVVINKDLLKKYYTEIKDFSAEVGLPIDKDIIATLFSMPDVLKSDKTSLEDEDWETLRHAIIEAVEKNEHFRAQEGVLLEKDMLLHVNLILEFLAQVEPYEKLRIQNLRERFKRNQEEFLDKSMEKFDENRFEQEIFWYLEKLDITEEKIRLRKHCDYFKDIMDNEDTNGRKLGFVCQEIGREINTLGSKAGDAEIQRIVVQMKDELEKIKEQLGNIL